MKRSASALAALALTLAAPAARAHPHVFVDVGIDFVMDGRGRLGALRVTWLFDPLYSVLVLEELGIDPALPPDPQARATLGALQPEWAAEFGGEGSLFVDGADAALGEAREFTGDMDDGRLVIAFERPLEAPLDPRGAAVLAAVYDPTYFVAYFLTQAPRVEGGAGCAAVAMPFEADGALADLQSSLLDLSMEETPADPMVGRLFADRARLSCG
jgi:polyphosphate kinase